MVMTWVTTTQHAVLSKCPCPPKAVFGKCHDGFSTVAATISLDGTSRTLQRSEAKRPASARRLAEGQAPRASGGQHRGATATQTTTEHHPILHRNVAFVKSNMQIIWSRHTPEHMRRAFGRSAFVVGPAGTLLWLLERRVNRGARGHEPRMRSSRLRVPRRRQNAERIPRPTLCDTPRPRLTFVSALPSANQQSTIGNPKSPRVSAVHLRLRLRFCPPLSGDRATSTIGWHRTD